MRYFNKLLYLFASRAYLQQSPTCTRVQINKLHLLLISVSHLTRASKSCLLVEEVDRQWSVLFRSMYPLQNINVTWIDITSSSHDEPKICLVVEWDICFPYAYMILDHSYRLSQCYMHQKHTPSGNKISSTQITYFANT